MRHTSQRSVRRRRFLLDTTPQFAPVAWGAAQLTVCRILGALSSSLTLPTAPDLLFVHTSLRSDRDNLDVYTTDDSGDVPGFDVALRRPGS